MAEVLDELLRQRPAEPDSPALALKLSVFSQMSVKSGRLKDRDQPVAAPLGAAAAGAGTGGAAAAAVASAAPAPAAAAAPADAGGAVTGQKQRRIAAAPLSAMLAPEAAGGSLPRLRRRSQLAEGGRTLLEGGATPRVADACAPLPPGVLVDKGLQGGGHPASPPVRTPKGGLARPRPGPLMPSTDAGCASSPPAAASPPRRPQLPARGRPRRGVGGMALEFKPSSRSSSEAGSRSPRSPLSPRAGGRSARGKAARRGAGRAAARESDRDRAPSVSSSVHSSQPSRESTCYVNFDRFDLQIENGRAPTKLVSWDQLLLAASGGAAERAGPRGEAERSLRQAIDSFGWQAPTKLQAVAVPCVVQACRDIPEAKSYTFLQAAGGLGKTSSLALGLLASARREVCSLQFVVVSANTCEDLERYLNALGFLCPLEVAYFKSEVSQDLDADMDRALRAQIIVGHPAGVLEVLEATREQISLSSVRALLLDDASEVIADGWVQKVCEVNQMLSLFVATPLRYVVLSSFVESETKPALRALKSSLMSKKNMFDLAQQVGRIKKFVKHYLVQIEPEGWMKALSQLQDMIYIPKAVLFCDSEPLFQRAKLAGNPRGEWARTVSLSVNDSAAQTLQDGGSGALAFCKEQSQKDFLLTRSEPNIFQASLPRVFWVVHFGIEANLSWYGCRLLCLDSKLREQRGGKGVQHDGVSLLFLPPSQRDTVQKLERMFGIHFEPLPFGGFG
ncbi:unnamed protein product [Prorocentrum cordatum]|uniref:ATP-dependent RNA helicase n=2 Tax=Prorocentrum cordatum TaxID=2364126 RepID=A0ABN9S4B1_9DINO|nr:unnamed protein product [Polarella glacialis]